jgi:integrase
MTKIHAIGRYVTLTGMKSDSESKALVPAKSAGLPAVERLADDPKARRRARMNINCHTFRATGITAYLEAGGTLENAQLMAAHESPRTTKLYDRTGDEITLDEVERIVI